MGPVTAWAGRVEIMPSLTAFGYSTKLCAPPAERAGRAGTQRRHCQAIAAPADGLVLGWAGLGWAGLASGEETTDLENLS